MTTEKTYTHLIIYCDGASRGNPGSAAVGIHIIDRATYETVVSLAIPLGKMTNNQAEYWAVLHALGWLAKNRASLADDAILTFRMDSNLVVQQMKGNWKIKDATLQTLARDARAQLQALHMKWTFENIPREQNKVADKLANQALDTE
jgi:probable phosphoglycerate mutase